MLVGLDRLNQIFGGFPQQTKSYEGKCSSCGCHINVMITKTSGGYGFQHGVMYESSPGHFELKCERCFNKSREEQRPR